MNTPGGGDVLLYAEETTFYIFLKPCTYSRKSLVPVPYAHIDQQLQCVYDYYGVAVQHAA